MTKASALATRQIKSLIFLVRGQKVILDSNLAVLLTYSDGFR